MTAKKKERKKPGPLPLGLCDPFTMRLFPAQEERVLRECRKYGLTKGEVIRNAIDTWRRG